MAAALVAAAVLAGAGTLWLTGRSPLGSPISARSAFATPTALTGPNTIHLTGAVNLAQTITPTCRLWGGPNTYWFSAEFADSTGKDTFLEHYRLNFWIENYHGAGTYLARTFGFDKLELDHIAPDPAGGLPKADASYGWVDLNGIVTISAGGLSGTIKQDLAALPSTNRVHMSASWECTHFGDLPQTIN
jgi:hypothetical protein